MNNHTESQFIKRDCVNYHNGVCKALDNLYCAKDPCKFFKTHQMVHEQVKRIRKRIPGYGSDSYD